MVPALLMLCFIGSAKSACQENIPTCEVGGWSPFSDCMKPEIEELKSFKIKRSRTDSLALLKRDELHNTQKQSHKNQRELRSEISGAVPCENGYAGLYPCSNIDQHSFISIADLDPTKQSSTTSGVRGWTDAVDGHEYVIMALDTGTAFLRVTDAEAPQVLGFLHSTRNRVGWRRDVTVLHNHAYIVAETHGHGMQVMDLTNLRGLQADKSRVFEASAVYMGVSSAHSITSNPNSDSIYISGATGTTCEGLHMMDVRNPSYPVFSGCLSDDGYVSHAQCMTYDGPDSRYQGNEVCFCFNEDKLVIVDVTDNAHTHTISRSRYQGYGYVQQGACSQDLTTLLMSDAMHGSYDMRTETFVWDIRDLEAPSLMHVQQARVQAIAGEQHVTNGLVYQANYQSGLRVLRLDEASHELTEVAYFDTYPDSTIPEYGGAVATFPFFQSGTVAVSSREYGLFLLGVHAPEKTVGGEGLMRRHKRTMRVQERSMCPALEEFQPC